MNEIKLTFLCHADFSGRIRKSREDIGFGAFYAEVSRLRAADPEGTLLLDAGDAFCTNYWAGLPLVGAMERNGTDAMVLGNHEFDRGAEFLERCIAACSFPVLCANVRKKTGEPIPGTKPYVMLERRGVRIGVLGLTTEYTPYMVEASAFSEYEVTSAAQAAAHYIPQLRAEGAEVVVVLTHMPFYTDGTELSGELIELLDHAPEADVWVGGHIPGDVACCRSGMCVVKAGFGGASIACAELTLDAQTHSVLRRACRIVHTDPEGQADAKTEAYIHSITDPLEPYFREVLAQSTEHWRMTLAHESRLGDFLADCLRSGGGTELAYMNATGACGEIRPGAVTREELLYCAAYNDELFTGKITGKQLWELMEAVYEPERFGNNAALCFSGFCVCVDHTQAAGRKVQRITLADGTAVQPERSYSVTTSAYMASGGNGTGGIADRIHWEPTGKRFHEVVCGYASSLGTLRVEGGVRLHETGEPENNHAPY